MSSSFQGQEPSGANPSSAISNFVFRAPRRISITVPYDTYQKLIQRSDDEGRSLSNLAAFLLEQAMTS